MGEVGRKGSWVSEKEGTRQKGWMKKALGVK
jgi:hypothetical protein